MADYGHDLLFGTFLTPGAAAPAEVVRLTQLSERVGLDLASFQDHPYQPAFLDTWTLMSYLAAVTSRIRLTANVLNLPLRQPVVIARSAASLDRLSGGRVELGLGAGGFWEAIEASGGRKLSPGQALGALGEAIQIIREIWDTGQRGGVRVNGELYRVAGAKRGPAPAHDIGIWVGGYKPRMLNLIGRVADGWLPSLTYLPGGASSLPGLNQQVDEGALSVGRDPKAVRRLVNVTWPEGEPAARWAAQLAGLTLEHGISTFILFSDDDTVIERYGHEVAPEVRRIVAAARG
jgi:alkanesulfonate monooxygenase SsuD/methylene tetrahydromethanopterin reductase-like flavin-dependent oxidoreductase (luciferase family)